METTAIFKDRLAEAMKDLTVTELAARLGISKQSVSAYLTGVRKPKHVLLAEIARVLGVNPHWLAGHSHKKHPDRAAAPTGVRVPVYGRVAAGIPIEAIENVEDYEEISAEMAARGTYIALTIHGQSMEPRMNEGDVVIVRLQEDVESGETAIVMVNGGDSTCKKIKKTPEGVMLISTNPAFEPMFYSNEQIERLPVRILGKVVELRAKY
jgi:repressor LexA